MVISKSPYAEFRLNVIPSRKLSGSESQFVKILDAEMIRRGEQHDNCVRCLSKFNFKKWYADLTDNFMIITDLEGS